MIVCYGIVYHIIIARAPAHTQHARAGAPGRSLPTPAERAKRAREVTVSPRNQPRVPTSAQATVDNRHSREDACDSPPPTQVINHLDKWVQSLEIWTSEGTLTRREVTNPELEALASEPRASKLRELWVSVCARRRDGARL